MVKIFQNANGRKNYYCHYATVHALVKCYKYKSAILNIEQLYGALDAAVAVCTGKMSMKRKSQFQQKPLWYEVQLFKRRFV